MTGHCDTNGELKSLKRDSGVFPSQTPGLRNPKRDEGWGLRGAKESGDVGFLGLPSLNQVTNFREPRHQLPQEEMF